MQSQTESMGEPPAWLKWFINDAVHGIVDRHDAAPIGCHFYFDSESDVWEISIFMSRTEVYGGAADGKHVPSGMQIDVSAVAVAFDSAPRVYWQSEKFSSEDQLGNHMSFEGVARGCQVWLRILQSPPEWATPGRLLHAASGQIQNIW